MKWKKTTILTSDGERQAACPLILSASRRTDIPAFYADWFIHRLTEGYVKWTNPFNQEAQYVSLKKVRAIVFWTKNPAPLVKYFKELDKRRIAYYFQFTLNDYDESLEKNVPPLETRIETFKMLSGLLGRERVVWRFDPLMLTDKISPDILLRKIEGVGRQVSKYTRTLVFSYADISDYPKVSRNLSDAHVDYRDFDTKQMKYVAEGIRRLNRDWGLELATCCEDIDLEQFGIKHGKCIDDGLISRITADEELRQFLGHEKPEQLDLFLAIPRSERRNLKDPGQRRECGCIISKDIGAYNTCPHLCTYCYANRSHRTVLKNMQRIKNDSESLID